MLQFNTVGYVSQDIKESGDKNKVFSLAANFYNPLDKQKNVIFIRCYISNHVKPHMHEFIKKGSRFFVSLSPMKIDIFNDKPSFMCKVDGIEFLDSQQKQENSNTEHNSKGYVANSNNEDAEPDIDDLF